MKAIIGRACATNEQSKPSYKWGVAILSLIVFLGSGCAEDQETTEDPDLCFERYIEEYADQYPEATLKKTAALKCVS